jgi:HSP20 family protein
MFYPDRNAERMMDMWVDLLSHIEDGAEGRRFSRTNPKVGTVEEKDDSITLTADLPGVEKEDIELSVHTESVAFKASTEDRDYDFGQSFDFELNPDKVKATFNNGVLDVKIEKVAPAKGKIIKIE